MIEYLPVLVVWWAFGFAMIYRGALRGHDLSPAAGPEQFAAVVFVGLVFGGLRPFYDILAALWWAIYRWPRWQRVAQ